MVRVAAHLGRQIERNRESGLTLLEQITVTTIRFLGAAEARVLAHRPQPSTIHRRLHATREWVLAGKAELVHKVEAVQIVGIVSAFDLDSRAGDEILLALGSALERRVEFALLPILSGRRDFAIIFRHRELPRLLD